MLIFRCFLVQAGDFILYGVCKLKLQYATAISRFHKELRFFFSLLKRKKEAKKEKSSHSTCTIRSSITRRLHVAKIPRRGKQAAAAAVTLPFSQLKLGRKVSGDSPLSLLKRKKEAKKEKSSRFTCTTRSSITRRLHKKLSLQILINKDSPEGHTGGCCRRNITLFTLEIGA